MYVCVCGCVDVWMCGIYLICFLVDLGEALALNVTRRLENFVIALRLG